MGDLLGREAITLVNGRNCRRTSAKAHYSDGGVQAAKVVIASMLGVQTVLLIALMRLVGIPTPRDIW